MSNLLLDPNASVFELLRDRIAIGRAISMLHHPSCNLPEAVRQSRLADLRDALEVHRAAIDAAYARADGGPCPYPAGTRKRTPGVITV